jgi:uncharacterized protein YcnI
MRKIANFIGISGLLTVSAASAHISVSSGPGFAETSQVITFGVGHGCEDTDTLRVRIEIPEEVLVVRALPSTFGLATVERNDAELVTAVTWEKTQESLIDADLNYYQLQLRIGVPAVPFTTLYFPTIQTCQAADGTLIEVPWVSTDPTAMDVEPAPGLSVVPERFSGWNRYTVPAAIEDLTAFFSDALIVWRDDAAFSANPATVELIGTTPGVTVLESLEAGDEVWVKY